MTIQNISALKYFLLLEILYAKFQLIVN